MKQSNIDYKQTYHFRGRTGVDESETTSVIPDQPDVNTKIKENPYKQNVEIEKDEIVLKPDFMALHKAGGKKHSKGGTGVYLPDNSFVFSDDKSLAINEKEGELFELKGIKETLSKNTPARILGRNVDLKHYNTLVTILDDDKKDEVSKKTAAKMLEKYFDIIGNIAFIQEQKKDFPQGLPEFSVGTAPVYKTEVKQDVMENKQYMKYGGNVENPYKMQDGGGFSRSFIDKMKKKEVPQVPPTPYSTAAKTNPYHVNENLGVTSPTGTVSPAAPQPPQVRSGAQTVITAWKGDRNYKANASKYSDQQWQSFATQLGFKVDPKSGEPANKQFQAFLFNNPTIQPKIEQLHKQYGDPKDKNWIDGYLGHRWDVLMDPDKPKTDSTCPCGNDEFGNCLECPDINKGENTPPSITETTTQAPPDKITPNGVTGDPQNGIQVGWEFTPEQKRAQLFQGMKWAGVDREMPMRSRYKATYVDPYLMNPEQAVADARAMANTGVRAAGATNPYVANAQAASIAGQYMNTAPGIRTQYDNQNQGIMNQTRAGNNQIKNNESMVNMQNDQNYWREGAIGRQNFKNMRGFMGDKWEDTRARQVESNEKLAYNMMTLGPNPAYGFDWKTGNFLRNDKNILDVQTDSKSDAYTTIANTIMGKIQNGQTPSKQEVDFFKALSLGKLPFSPKKKGGIIGNPYKK